MIRLLRRVGSLKAGTETDQFDAAAEAAFVSDGTAEPVEGPRKPRPYSDMKKGELLDEAQMRGLDVSPRAKVQELIEALEHDDDA